MRKTKGQKRKEKLKFYAALFLGIPLRAFFSGLAGITPSGGRHAVYNFTSMYIALGVNIVCYTSDLAHRFLPKKTLWSWIFLYLFYATFIPSVGGVGILNLVYASFPSWKVIVPLAAMYPIASLLPFLNEPLAKFIYVENFAPRTCLGKSILYLALTIGPSAGVFGAMLSQSIRRTGNGVIGYSILGFVLHLGLVWGTVGMVYQVWELRPWKETRKEQ